MLDFRTDLPILILNKESKLEKKLPLVFRDPVRKKFFRGKRLLVEVGGNIQEGAFVIESDQILEYSPIRDGFY